MTRSQAKQYAHTLSEPSKMPTFSYGIPAKNCTTGAALAKIPGSVCSQCYALKGRYVMYDTVRAQRKRLQKLLANLPMWTEAMVYLISHNKRIQKLKVFRWHDSGDLQSYDHFVAICNIAERLPHIHFWLPTRERVIINEYIQRRPLPSNMVVRLVAAMINQRPSLLPGCVGSAVHDRQPPPGIWTCPAPQQNGECKRCRACWNPEIQVVSYALH